MSTPEQDLSFPKNFLWGAAISGQQHEGPNPNSSISTFFREKASVFAREEIKSLQKYYQGPDKEELIEYMSDPSIYIPNGSADHYNRYRQDLEMFKDFGHNAYRFEIPRSRIEQSPGVINEKEKEHYKDVIEYSKKLGITPIPTLDHWDEPLHVSRSGGLMSQGASDRYRAYIRGIADIFYGLPYVASLNEPTVKIFKQVLEGTLPPGNKFRMDLWFKALDQLIKIHNISAQELKKVDNNIKVGITQNIVNFDSDYTTPLHKLTTNLCSWFWNDYALDKAYKHGTLDFIGAQYYLRQRRNLFMNSNKTKGQLSDLGWEVYPPGLSIELKRLSKRYPGTDLLITEIGVPTRDDSKKQEFIRQTVQHAHQAITEGANLKGYVWWCALGGNAIGNRVVHEWNRGVHPLANFELFAVNQSTQERRPRQSAYLLKEIATTNSLRIPLKEGVSSQLPL